LSIRRPELHAQGAIREIPVVSNGSSTHRGGIDAEQGVLTHWLESVAQDHGFEQFEAIRERVTIKVHIDLDSKGLATFPCHEEVHADISSIVLSVDITNKESRGPCVIGGWLLTPVLSL